MLHNSWMVTLVHMFQVKVENFLKLLEYFGVPKDILTWWPSVYRHYFQLKNIKQEK